MKTRSGFFLLILIVFIGLISCEDPSLTKEELFVSVSAVFPSVKPGPDPMNFNPDLTYGSVTDIDGNIYKTIQIGSQQWIAENLKTTKYNDGNPILLGYGGPAGYTDWFNLGDSSYKYYGGAYCWFDNDEAVYKNAFGAIYNWHSVGTGKLCPNGWHVPTVSDWNELISYLGGAAGYNEVTKYAMISCSEKKIYDSGFAPVLAGELCGWGFLGSNFWWSATSMPTDLRVPYAYIMSFIGFDYEPQSFGHSVRCLKD
jgi:uncharacterized protein (TIGR02145 family)